MRGQRLDFWRVAGLAWLGFDFLLICACVFVFVFGFVLVFEFCAILFV